MSLEVLGPYTIRILSKRANFLSTMKLVNIFFLILQSGCSVFGIRSEETPSYEVLLKEDNKEIRSYSSHIVAKTIVVGDYRQAQSEGFKILASYIFGDNEKKQSLAMTAPVVQEQTGESESISMTAPVSLQGEGNRWVMTFMMPSKYSLDELPTPKDKRISIEEVPAKLIASLEFSGGRGAERNTQKAEELRLWLATIQAHTILRGPISAGYDPPWTLPFFRRNEVHFEIKNH